MRINARLDESRSRKLELLSRATGLSTSDIVKQAIDVYYDQVKGQRPRPAEILGSSGRFLCTCPANGSNRRSSAEGFLRFAGLDGAK